MKWDDAAVPLAFETIDGPLTPAPRATLRFDYQRRCFVHQIGDDHLDVAWRPELMPAIAEGVTGMCSGEQAEALLALAQRANPRGVLVEVGSFEGYSAIHLGWGAKTGSGQPVYCVDPHEGDLGVRRVAPTWEAFLLNVTRAGVADVVRPIRQTSAVAAASFGHPVSLCYIDALHDYESVRNDFDSWSAHLVDGAIVAFDDAVDDFPGVQRLERELRDGAGNFFYEGPLGVGFFGRWRR